MTTGNSWLWPNRTIGKRESGELRAEHNRLNNAYAELAEALAEAERVIRHAAQESEGRVKREIVGGWRYHADKIRATLAKATGGGA